MPSNRWIAYAWAAWVVLIFAMAVRPFLWHVNIFRQIDARLYYLLLTALPLLILAGVAYHFLRRLGFWRYEPVVIPAAVVVLLAVYAPLAVAVTLWIALAAFVTGKQIMGWWGASTDLSVCILAGFGVFSCVLFGIGLAGGFRTWMFALLFAFPLIIFAKNLARLLDELRMLRLAWTRDFEVLASHVSLAVFAAIVLALFTAAAILTPAWDGDAIRSHLALARAYLIQNSVAVPPALNYGYYPQGFEVLASAAYALGGQTAAQMINPLFFALALLLAYRIARRCGIARSWAVTGVALGAAVPFLHAAGSVVKNDLPMAAYQLAAVLFYLHWRESSNFRWILGSAFFLALSFDVKDVAVFGAIPLALLYLPAVWRAPSRFRAALSLAVIVLGLGLFWQTRTYLAKGSPLYPAGAGLAVTTFHKSRSRGDRIKVYLAIPYLLHFEGRRASYASPNPLGIVLLILAPLWLLRPQDTAPKAAELIVWFFLLVYYVPWSTSFAVPRYAIGPVLLLVLLGVRPLAQFSKWASLPAMAGAFLFALPVIIVLEMAPAQIPLLLKQIDRTTFLRRTLPPYPAVEYLAQHATSADRVASVGNWAVAYAPNPVNFWHYYSDNRRYSPALVQRALEESQPQYLILPNSKNLPGLETAAQQFHRLERIYSDKDFAVYSLPP